MAAFIDNRERYASWPVAVRTPASKLLGSGAEAVERGRMPTLRVQAGNEGAPIPRVWGRMRVAGRELDAQSDKTEDLEGAWFQGGRVVRGSVGGFPGAGPAVSEDDLQI